MTWDERAEKFKNEFIKKAILKFGNTFDYSYIEYKNNSTKIKIICPIHNEFYISPAKHLKSPCGCPKCSKDNADKKLRKDTEYFIRKSKEVHGDRYYYNLSEYINNRTDVIILCNIHEDFSQSPSNHYAGKGCPKCANELTGTKLSKGIDKFIEDARERHGDRYYYNLSEYVNWETQVLILCCEHGDFLQIAADHTTNGSGCPKCCSSRGETEIRLFLLHNNINYIEQHTFETCKNIRPLPFDFYLPEYNICVEYDGIQHYQPVKYFGGKEKFEKLKYTDSIKNKFCDDNSIKLFRIRYDENIEIKVNEIMEYVKCNSTQLK